MTKKPAASLTKEERVRMHEIRTRHGGSESVELWASTGASLKDRVIGELEEMMRESGDTEFVKALGLAIDVLDTTSVAGALGTDGQTQSDIRWLLERITG